MTQITEKQYNLLVSEIYDTLINMPEMGLGEMGECTDTAKIIVDNWLQKAKVETDF